MAAVILLTLVFSERGCQLLSWSQTPGVPIRSREGTTKHVYFDFLCIDSIFGILAERVWQAMLDIFQVVTHNNLAGPTDT